MFKRPENETTVKTFSKEEFAKLIMGLDKETILNISYSNNLIDPDKKIKKSKIKKTKK